MGDCMRSFKRIAASTEVQPSTASLVSSKRQKVDVSPELHGLASRSRLLHLKSPCLLSHPMDNPLSAVTSSNSPAILSSELPSTVRSDDFSSSRCSTIHSCDIVRDSMRFLDLEARSLETEISTCMNGNKFSRETSPSSELCGSSEGEMESPAKKKSQSPEAHKMPSEAEIEEFFSVAEKCEQKRFAEKYNYDIVKDVPLEGRYQWIRLKP